MSHGGPGLACFEPGPCCVYICAFFALAPALIDGATADFNRLLEEGGVRPIIYDRPVT